MNNKLIYNLFASLDKVGFEFYSDHIDIFFPYGYDLTFNNENEKIKSILDLLITINDAKTDDYYSNYDNLSGLDEIIPINSYLWVINDYIKNGLYNVKEKKYIVSQKGKINWKRTFKTKPIYSDNDIIYLNPIVEYNARTENVITWIHNKCLKISVNTIGRLFGNIEIPIVPEYEYDNDACIMIVKKELAKTFDDRRKILFNHLIRILENKTSNNETDTIKNILTYNYKFVWEKMVKSVFGNSCDLKKYFPTIKWVLRSGRIPKNTMRPDAVIEKENELYILDGKYYKYGMDQGKSLPGAEDVDKQITYAEYNKNKKKKIYSAFILPFNHNDNKFSTHDYIYDHGYVTNDARSFGENDKTRNVAIIFVDTRYLIDCYLGNKKQDDLDLINSIVRSIEL